MSLHACVGVLKLRSCIEWPPVPAMLVPGAPLDEAVRIDTFEWTDMLEDGRRPLRATGG